MDRPHRRKNLLTGDWVLVSPQRLGRPWQGAVASTPPSMFSAHDPACYLCPGNARAGGHRNPAYAGVYVFDNDFPALLSDSIAPDRDSLLVCEPETGVCRVICYSPDHSAAMSRLSVEQIEAVVETWSAQFRDLSADPRINAVTIFENRGEMMGASNPHPHGQVWATASVPNELARETFCQSTYRAETGRPLLIDYLERELADTRRIVCANDCFVVVTPFWAAWPFETLVLPRRPVSDLVALNPTETRALAEILADLTRTYDAVFDTPFPYTLGWHQRPTQRAANGDFVLHAHVYPPLLRSASVRKFMVGFEMLAMPQRDMTPENAAEILRSVRQSLKPMADVRQY